MVEDEQAWIVNPLTKTDGIREVVIRREGLLKPTREYCRLNKELIGFIHGFLYNGSLLLVGMNTFGVGTEVNSELDTFYLPRHNIFMREIIEHYPNLATILYHTHPKLEPSKYPEETLQELMEEIQHGIFDYLRDYGLRPTIRSAIGEFSRTLSPEDIEQAIGNVVILLTDTRYDTDELSHINVYRINRRTNQECILNKGMLTIDTLPVVLLEDKPEDVRRTFMEVADLIHKIQIEIREGYREFRR